MSLADSRQGHPGTGNVLAAFCWLGLHVPRATGTLELASFFCRYKGACVGFRYVLLQQMHIETHWAARGGRGQGEWASVLPDVLPGEREWEEKWSQVCHETPRGLRGGLASIQLGTQRGFREKVEDGARP